MQIFQFWACSGVPNLHGSTKGVGRYKGKRLFTAIYGSTYSSKRSFCWCHPELQLTLISSKQFLKNMRASSTLPVKTINIQHLYSSLHFKRVAQIEVNPPDAFLRHFIEGKQRPTDDFWLWALNYRHSPTKATGQVILKDFSPKELSRQQLSSAKGRAQAR